MIAFDTPQTVFGIDVDLCQHDKKVAIKIVDLAELRVEETSKAFSKQHDVFKDQGWQLIHVLSSELATKPSIVESRVNYILHGTTEKVSARSCKVELLKSKVACNFLNVSHIQGSGRSKFHFGLIDITGRIVMVMSVSPARFHPTAKLELIRVSSLPGVSVVGGASKLLAAVKNQFPNQSIVSYADRRWSTGKLYEQLGFKLENISPACYWYFRPEDTTKLWHRSSFQKHKLPKLLGEQFDASKTEIANMKDAGWKRVFDCGNYVFMLE